MRHRTLLLLVLLAAGAVRAAEAPKPAAAAPPALRIFGASSLADVLPELGRAWQRRTGTGLRFSFNSSATLARQLENGAPADVIVAADEEWMDDLQGKKLIRPATRRDVAGNDLVLVAPRGSGVQLAIAPGADFTAALLKALGAEGRLAVGDPASVPAGRYARKALESLGAWDAVASRLVPAENVRTALLYVARQEAPLGIVYATDAQSNALVRVVDTFPADTHPPVRYPAAATATAGPQAADFVAFLGSEDARAIFARYGFRAP